MRNLNYTYAGIGARKTPPNILDAMTFNADVLSTLGFTLHSGAAAGADTAFEAGAESKRIFLPWSGFNGSSSPLNSVCGKALAMASELHPAWERLSPSVRALMGRNMYQVLGETLDAPVDFVIAWTPKGRVVGGTGQALRAAAKYAIPVFNMATDPKCLDLAAFLMKHGAL